MISGGGGGGGGENLNTFLKIWQWSLKNDATIKIQIKIKQNERRLLMKYITKKLWKAL